MKRPPNRMAHPQNREEEPMRPEPAVEEEEIEKAEQPPLPDRDRGIVCKWCKVRGRSVVRKTYANNVRMRFCESCRREFMTQETVG